jgi:hypothetical protein
MQKISLNPVVLLQFMNNFYPLDYVTPAIFFSPELTQVLERKKFVVLE